MIINFRKELCLLCLSQQSFDICRHKLKQAGCHTYDMWGAPDHFNEEDPLWGVYRFKDGFGGQVECTLGAWDYPVRPFFYRLYSQILPRILGWMRNRGKSATKRSMST